AERRAPVRPTQGGRQVGGCATTGRRARRNRAIGTASTARAASGSFRQCRERRGRSGRRRAERGETHAGRGARGNERSRPRQRHRATTGRYAGTGAGQDPATVRPGPARSGTAAAARIPTGASAMAVAARAAGPAAGTMSDTLSTLVQRCRHQQEIRKSRFLAIAAPVSSAEQALAFLREAADPAATHNCWAWRIGDGYRFNDDGEPGGTAGRPILQAIDGQQMDGVAVVVTRWYGGIKLGAGGLVRAYGGTAAECLRQAERIALVAMTRLGVRCEFAELALLKARLKELQGEV